MTLKEWNTLQAKCFKDIKANDVVEVNFASFNPYFNSNTIK